VAFARRGRHDNKYSTEVVVYRPGSKLPKEREVEIAEAGENA
jgi:hypothetical protein